MMLLVFQQVLREIALFLHHYSLARSSCTFFLRVLFVELAFCEGFAQNAITALAYQYTH
jgi:hypothetical protein